MKTSNFQICNRGFLDREERPALLVMGIDVEFAAVEAGNCDFPFVPANQLRQTD